jgi:Carboxypeptidase regulatory-like domain
MSITRKSAVLLLSLFFAALAFAQGGATGAITGVVQDPTASVLAGAKVNIVNEATGQTIRQFTTNSSGAFTAPLLPVGAYTVEVSAAGFATTKFPGIQVRITETTRMNAVLKPSAAREVVEVQSQVAGVETTVATTGESLGNTTITALPLATRNFQQLLTLSAGASSDLNNASQLGRGAVYIHVNGGREDNNNYLIEGISASDYAFGELTFTPLPSPDAIEEFKVSTSLYDATQGRNGGGNINAVLKSGTLKFHGGLWEYLRNTSLNAEDYFLGKVVIKQNIFGGDLGGPVGPKAQFGFFYVNYQGTRQRSGASPGTYINSPAIPIVPTDRSAAHLESVFSSPAVTGCPAVPLTSIDPVALALLNAQGTQFGNGPGGFLFPTVPGTPGVTQTFNAATGTCSSALNTGSIVLTRPGKFTDDQFTTNWDRDFRNGKDHLGVRFFWSNSDTFQPFGADNFSIQTGGQPVTSSLNFPMDIPLHSRFGSITETHTFSNTLVNEFRFGINVIGDKLHNEAPITGKDIGINNPTQNRDPNMYRLKFTTFEFGPYPTEEQTALSDNFTWLDTLSWTHGVHQFRFGGEIDRVTLRRDLPISDNGYVFFIPVGPPTLPTDFQSFLAGSPLLGEGGGGLGNHDYRVPSFAWFVQDDYRVRKDLTLNLGFRNEFVGAPHDTLCHTGNTNPLLAATTGQPFVYPTCVNQFGLTGIKGTLNSAGLQNEYATVWEPRIGFAYDVGGRHTTSIRAGYGIYAVREDLGAVDNLAISPPAYPFKVGFLPGPGSLTNLFSTSFPVPPLGAPPTQAFVPVPSFFTGFPTDAAFPGGDPTMGPGFSGTVQSLIELAVPLHWVIGTTQQWNLTIQRELGRDWFAELGYIGTKGTRLRSTYDDDQATLATAANPVTLPYACNGGAGTCKIIDSTAANSPARARYLGINPADFEDFAPNSDSHYGALQATLAHRFSKGLYFQGAYTYSKSIDDVSTASVAFVTRVNNQTDARASRGLSDFDRRHRFVASAVYQFPFFSSSNGITRAALAGWETSPVVILQSGTPFTMWDPAGGGAYNLASPSATAEFSPGFTCSNGASRGSVTSRVSNWANPAAFSPDPAAPVGTPGTAEGTLYGNTPRNCIVGPHQRNMDLTMGKTFKITEQQNLRFRADFFNLFNHPSFANPGVFNGGGAVGPASTPSGVGGLAPITSVIGTPRLIQFSLKYSF